MEYDQHDFQSPEKPWYFFPENKLYFRVSAAVRNISDNSVTNFGTLYFNATNSQGYIYNTIKIKSSIKMTEKENYNVMYILTSLIFTKNCLILLKT